MYLFSRRARLSGSQLREAMAWAVQITERVTQTTGLQVRLWNQTFSPELGTLRWSTFVPDLSTLETANDKLMVDDGYLDLTDKGTAYTIPGTLDDTLCSIIHGAPDPARHVEYVAVVRSNVMGGNIARAIAIGVEIAERAQQITGTPTMFLADATGNYGGVVWSTAYANVGELERAQQTLNTDPSFVEFIDREAASVFASDVGATTQTVLRSIV